MGIDLDEFDLDDFASYGKAGGQCVSLCRELIRLHDLGKLSKKKIHLAVEYIRPYVDEWDEKSPVIGDFLEKTPILIDSDS